MICPDCGGDRQTIANHVSYANGSHGYNVPHKCTRCQGTGECPDEMAEWIIEGRKMREQRVNGGNYRNLGTEAKRRGMTASQLSAMEMGRIKPVPEK